MNKVLGPGLVGKEESQVGCNEQYTHTYTHTRNLEEKVKRISFNFI